MFYDIDEKIKSLNAFTLSSKFEGGKIHGHKNNNKNIGFIEIISESGVKGYSENYSAIYAPEIFEIIVQYFQKSIVGKKIRDLKEINFPNSFTYIGRNGFVKSVLGSVEVAILDLVGKLKKKPAYSFFRKKPKFTKCYFSGGSVIMSPKDISEDVLRALNDGFNIYKMRIGYFSWSQDIKRIKVAKENLGKNKIIFDAIMGTHKKIWNYDQALKKIKILKRFDPLWIEEPLHPDDINGYLKLKKLKKINIAFGEAYSGRLEYDLIINNKLSKFLQFDVTSSGGIIFVKDIIKKAEQKGIICVPHVWGSDLSLVANLTLSAISNNIKYFEYPSIKLEISNFINSESYTLKNGFIIPTDVFGMGINISDKIKSKFNYKKINTFSL